VVHEVPASTPSAVQQVIFGRSDQEQVVPSTRAEAAILRPRAADAGSFSIHSPRPVSAVPVARHLEENLVYQEAQRARDAAIRQLLEDQRAFVEEHREFMTRAARATSVAQDVADDTAAKTASLRASVQEAAEESKRRSSAMASLHSIEPYADALAAERQRAQELEEKLAALRTRRAEQRANREKGEQEKCEEGRIAAAERHQNTSNELGDITNRIRDAADEKANWRALQDQRWAERPERQDRKTTQIQRLEEMMSENRRGTGYVRRMAEEDAAANANRPGYAEVIAQLERQNEEQLTVLRTLLAGEFISILIPTHSNRIPLQPTMRTSSIAITKRLRPCGKLRKNTFHLIFPTT
jgi:chromosome segregation ATPase